MRAIDVRIGHDDNSVVTDLINVKVVSDSTPETRDHRFDFVTTQHLV